MKSASEDHGHRELELPGGHSTFQTLNSFHAVIESRKIFPKKGIPCKVGRTQRGPEE